MQVQSEDLARGIPEYLSKADQAALKRALADFPLSKAPFYFTSKDADPLQGDIWRGVQIYDHKKNQLRLVQGMLLSNSCDVASDNARWTPTSLTFATIITVEKYKAVLLSANVDEVKVEEHLAQIRNQRVTSLFYLPPGAALKEESIALLQDLHSIPSALLTGDGKGERLATLSQFGFYLFLFKLSIHFCRFLEGVDRGSIGQASEPAVGQEG